MKSRLCQINNWPELAKAAKYRTSDLAGKCGVSTRELQRFILCEKGKCPHEWLNELRQMQALSLMGSGKSVKEIAFELGYRYPAHFSRDFKHFHGTPPTSTRNTSSLQRPG